MADCCRQVADDEIAVLPLLRPAPAGDWVCGDCGSMQASNQALAAHCAREHGRLRAMRTRVIGRTCLVCLRRFPNRSSLLDHLHEKALICRVNILLYHRPKPPEDVEQADWDQWEQEAACRARGERYDKSWVLTAQAFGPLQAFVIPIGHSRSSRYALMKRYLKCRVAAREVNFDAIFAALAGDDSHQEVDELPLDVLVSIW